MKTRFIIIAATIIAIVSCSKSIESARQELSTGQTAMNSSHFRSYSDAEAFANQFVLFLDGKTKTASRAISNGGCVTIPQTKGSGKDTLFYYFNYANRAGFSIVNANKHADPFICVTESGHYDGENGTGVPAVDFYLKNVKKELERSHPEIEPEDSLILPYSYTVDVYDGSSVSPLLTTKWGSIGVFGAYCPYQNSCGLVAAIAQIMAYHGKPYSYYLSVPVGGFSTGTLMSPNWYYMKMHVKNHTNSQICDGYHYQISALYADIGFQAGLNYFPDGSIGYFPNPASSVFNHYGFTAGALSSVNVSTITSSLDVHRPVFMTGSDNSAGKHEWVADGYQDYLIYRKTYAQTGPGPGYYLVNTVFIGEVHSLHINWGWQGECNGYFNFNTYNTNNAVSYDEGNGSTYNFSSNLEMIANIY